MDAMTRCARCGEMDGCHQQSDGRFLYLACEIEDDDYEIDAQLNDEIGNDSESPQVF